MFIVPFVASVSGMPVNVPPSQLNCPAKVTGAVKLMVPLPKLTVSFEAGTPAGLQLLVLNQSVETEPVQVKVAPEAEPAPINPKRQSQAKVLSRNTKLTLKRCIATGIAKIQTEAADVVNTYLT
jgi:hypothetical protein